MTAARCNQCHKVAKSVCFVEDGQHVYYQLECGHLLIKDKSFGMADQIDSFESIRGEKLMPFQKENVQFFGNWTGRICIFDEMGLGKTPTSIAIAHVYKLFPTVVVCKASLKYQWERQILDWNNPAEDGSMPRYLPFVVESSAELIPPGMSFYIVSYDTMSRPGVISKIEKVRPKLAIVDECQHVKNTETKRTQALFKLGQIVPNMVFLSGTPIKNNAAEFYPALHLCDPAQFPTKGAFLYRWVETYGSGPFIRFGGIKNYDRFRETTKHFIIRHTQEEVMPQLPPVRRNFMYTQVSDDRMLDLEAQFADYFYSAEDLGFEYFQNVLAYFGKMRHLAGLMKVEFTADYAKEFVEQTDQKIVIFTHHIDVRDELKKRLDPFLKSAGYRECLTIFGNMPPLDRERVKNQFNQDESVRILIASTLASGEGLDLHHQCSNAIMMERQWNPANEEQAEYRFKRIGQKAASVNITYMIAKETIDEDLTIIVESKRRKIAYSLDGKIQWDQNEILQAIAERVAARANSRRLR